MKKTWSLYIMITLYLLAGTNHFVNPAFYIKIIPPYLGDVVVVNKVAGLAELLLGLMLIFKPTRKLAALGIMIMLVAFIPSHIYMLQLAGTGAVVSPAWILWMRLLFVQPILIWWAWQMAKVASSKKASH